MTKDVGILVLGLIVAAIPFLGFTSRIEQIIFVISGLTIAVLAFFIRGELGGEKEETESFVQNGGQNTATNVIIEREKHREHEEEKRKLE